MRLLFGLLFLAVSGLAFIVWRTIMRSPKLDKFFDVAKRDEDADDILSRQRSAVKDLDARGRTLSSEQRRLQSELNKINKKKDL
jgi:hypothetical protein